MWRAGVLIAALWAVQAGAQCQPSGRATFVAGLDALDAGDLDAAAAAFDALVQIQPECAEAHNNLAVVLVEQGRLPEAVVHLRRAVALQPEYHRARLNLARVETLLASAAPAAAPAATRTVTPAPASTAAPTPVATPPQPTPVATPVLEVSAPPPAAPPSLAAVEPAGMTACVIDLPANEICVYRHAPDGLHREACYGIVAARVEPNVAWLTASDLSRQRIRLVDETGRRRLKIVDDRAAPVTGVVAVRAADYAALSAHVTPWRTGWVVQDAGRPPPSNPAAVADAVRAALERWRATWEAKQFDPYVALYSAGFAPQGDPGFAQWRARKQRLFAQPGALMVRVHSPSLFVLDDATVTVVFEQQYRSARTASTAVKVLRWRREAAGWAITHETVLQETYP